MLDVHPPHTPTHGWRDFFIHLITITIGLLIALSLEGLVEWQHHRHLVHEAEANMTSEIRSNAAGMQEHLQKLHQQQAELEHDMDTLGAIKKTKKLPADKHMSVTYTITSFDDVSWKTAQATGALAYMPYGHAREYSNIYSMQTNLTRLETTAGRDAAVALSSFYEFDDDKAVPTPDQITAIMGRISVLQGQLLIVDSFTKGLATHYDTFLKTHPGTE